MDLRVDEIDGSELAHLVEVRDDGAEWLLATVYPGVALSHPVRPEVRALSVERARTIVAAVNGGTAAEERAAIVAWLRAESAAADARGKEAAPLSQERVRARMIGAALYHAADAIERGDYPP